MEHSIPENNDFDPICDDYPHGDTDGHRGRGDSDADRAAFDRFNNAMDVLCDHAETLIGAARQSLRNEKVIARAAGLKVSRPGISKRRIRQGV